jgi:glycosyltransferase involved in cell wall biosynthesis
MKILHVTPTYLPAVRYGGPIYSVHGLCRVLVGLGHEVHVFTTNVDGEGNSDVNLATPVDVDGVMVWYFPSRYFRRLYFSPPMMKMLQKMVQDFDLLHLHSVFLWPTWAAARVARCHGVPYVLSPRGMLVKALIHKKSWLLKSCWIRLIEQKNLEQASAIHVTSSEEEKELCRFTFSLPPVATIANGVAAPSVWSENGVSDDISAVMQSSGYVLYFGRLNWKKGIDRLIRTWKDIPHIKLIVAGNDDDGYLAELQRIAQAEGVSNRIVFLPRFITGADKEALFASARLFILLSYSENFGITVLEAMIRGLPVAVTREVGAAEIVKASGGGKVLDNLESGGGVAAMLQDKQQLKKMSSRGSSYVFAQYNWQHIGARMDRLYCEVIDA